ncbi:MAG: ABC transporter permease [Solirubrobacteraceae bacterium]
MPELDVPQPEVESVARTDEPVAVVRRWFEWRNYVVYIAFVLVFLVFAFTLSGKGFLGGTNLLNIVSETAPITIIAVAMTFVIGAAEIDLSVGSVVGLTSVLAAIELNQLGLVGAIIVGLLAGVLVGAINGALVTLLRIPSFLVTLGMLGIASGAAQWIANSTPQTIANQTFVNLFGQGKVGPIQTPIIWMAVIGAVGIVVLRKTVYGRHVLATGGNEEAARFSGVPTKRIKFTVLLVCSMTAAFAGLVNEAFYVGAQYTDGASYNLSAIAAVIIGGTSLFGGRGSVVGTLVGSMLIGLINNGLLLYNLQDYQQDIVRGAIIILAVALQARD